MDGIISIDVACLPSNRNGTARHATKTSGRGGCGGCRLRVGMLPLGLPRRPPTSPSTYSYGNTFRIVELGHLIRRYSNKRGLLIQAYLRPLP